MNKEDIRTIDQQAKDLSHEIQAGAQMFRQVMGGAMLAGRVVGDVGKAFRSAPGAVRKAYGGAKTALNGAKIGGMSIAAGASYLSAKTGHRGAETHDKMMKALQGKDYKGNLAKRLENTKTREERFAAKGVTMKQAKQRARAITKVENTSTINAKGGILGTRKNNKRGK